MKKRRERDSCVRSEKKANIHDILAALIKLDNCGQIPSIAVSATELHMMPRFNPEEHVPSPVVERVQILENKFSQMISTLDRCLCENLELKDKIESNVSYHVFNNKTANKETSSSIVVEPPNTGNIKQSNSVISLDKKSIHSVDSEVFRRPKAQVKKMRRHALSVTGSNKHGSVFKGAPAPPKELFIYHVDKETCSGDISNYILNKEIKILDLKCMSHQDSISKSFKLKVSQECVDALLKDDFWPSGVKVRKFIPPKPKLHE